MRETTPLLPNHTPTPHEPTRSAVYLLLLALPIGGLQTAWSVEFSAGSSYLLTLGIPKPLLAPTWFAGPLMGILVQPYIGALSDGSRVPWGRRRPYLLAGTGVTVLSMLGLAWVRELTSPLGTADNVWIVKAVAVAGVYALNFGLNVVEASIRALITDCAPRHQQEAANAMASRITAVGSLAGFLAGSLDLARYLPFLGGSHFKVLCALSSITLLLTVLMSAGFVTEEDPRQRSPTDEKSVGGRLLSTLKILPPQIKTLFAVQAFACFAFFPVLFYGSVWVAEIYAAPFLRENPGMGREELDALFEEGTRRGARALAWNAVVMLFSTVLAPVVVTPTYDAETRGSAASLSRSSTLVSNTHDGNDSTGEGRFSRLRIPPLTLKRAWIASLALQATALLSAPLIHSVEAAVVAIAALGYTWALSAWAPFAIIGAETHAAPGPPPADSASSTDSTPDVPALLDDASQDENGDASMRNRVGAVFGIHNVVVCVAQAASSVVALGVFAVCQRDRGIPGDPSFAVLFGVSGAAGVVAVWLAMGIRDGLERDAVPG